LKITLYSNGCPQCNVLKAKLDLAKIEYEIFNDSEEMIKMGFRSVPMLEVDGAFMNFADATKWIKER
jgi:glutaredoxin